MIQMIKDWWCPPPQEKDMNDIHIKYPLIKNWEIGDIVQLDTTPRHHKIITYHEIVNITSNSIWLKGIELPTMTLDETIQYFDSVVTLQYEDSVDEYYYDTSSMGSMLYGKPILKVQHTSAFFKKYIITNIKDIITFLAEDKINKKLEYKKAVIEKLQKERDGILKRNDTSYYYNKIKGNKND